MRIAGYVRYTIACTRCRVEAIVEYIAPLVAGNEQAIAEELTVRVKESRRRSTVIAVRLLVDAAEPQLRRELLLKQMRKRMATERGLDDSARLDGAGREDDRADGSPAFLPQETKDLTIGPFPVPVRIGFELLGW